MRARMSYARALVAAVLVTVSAGPARAEKITLDQALERAARSNPDLIEASAAVRVAEGDLRGAGTIANNPELSVEAGPAYGGSGTFLDWGVSLSQRFELGGKRSSRRAAASSRRAAARLRLDWTRLEVEARVRRTFYLAVIAQERVDATRDAERFAAEVRQAATERLRSGAATQLELNTATAVSGRARSERLTAERELRLRREELAAAVFAPANVDLEPVGDVPTFAELRVSENQLVGGAAEKRMDVVAVRRDREAAEAELALARSLAIPDAALGVTYGRSGLEDSETVLFGLALELPLWNRNQGGKRAAEAELDRARIVEQAAFREADRTARVTYRNYQAAREAVLAFDRQVIEQLGENLELARESYRTGKIGLVEFNVVRRDLVETRLAFLVATADLIEARYALELATSGKVE